MRKIMVLMMVLAVVVTYSVVPMNQSFAASGKRPAKVKSVKAVALGDSETSINVSWKKAKHAKKYQVYRATKKKGKYKRVATTKQLTYTNKNLKDGKKYYYKVRAVNGKKKGKFSKVKSAKAKYVAPAPAPAGEVKEVPAKLGEARTRTLTTTIDMTARKYSTGKVVKVWVPIPQTDEYQSICGVSFEADTAAKARITYDKENGNKMFYVEWDADTNRRDRVATLKFTAKRYAVSRDKVVEDKTAAIPDDVKPYITEESEFVKVNDPIVKAYTAEATMGKTETVEKARAIYDWIIKNLERIDDNESLKNEKGEVNKFSVDGCGYGDTVAILTDLKEFGRAGGHCTDINSTFVAMCRAAGIPAREMFGIRLGNTEGEVCTSYQHCWAEFYVAGTGWVYADPGDVLKAVKGKNMNMTVEQVKKAKASEEIKKKTAELWAGVDNNRVVLSHGRDVTFVPAQSWGPCNTFGYPAAEVDGERLSTSFTNGDEFKYSIISSLEDRTVFVDAEYVKSEAEKKDPNTVIAEVSWGSEAKDIPSEYIPGAFHVNTDDLEYNTQDLKYEFWDLRGFNDPVKYKTLMDVLAQKYGITKDTNLICYGWDGCNSAPTRLAMAALMLGVNSVKVLDGGVPAWNEAGYPEAPASTPKPAESFGLDSPKHPEWVISTEEMLDKKANDSQFKLVSIRSYKEYTGEVSGYDYIPVAGEPEGAIWGRDTDDSDKTDGKKESAYFIDGKTVGIDTLNEYLSDYGASTSNHLAFYCGTGWRATIPFLICYQAGINNMMLWDDGWYVYSGAYYTGPYKTDFAPVPTAAQLDYPVQIGDPRVGEVEYKTVKELYPEN